MGKSKKKDKGVSIDEDLPSSVDLSDIHGMEPPNPDDNPFEQLEKEKKASKKKKFLKKFRKSLSHNSHKSKDSNDTDDDYYDDDRERRVPDHTRSAGEEQLKQNMWSEKIKGFRKGKGGRRGSTATGSDFHAPPPPPPPGGDNHQHSPYFNPPPKSLSDKEEPLDKDLGYADPDAHAAAVADAVAVPSKVDLGYGDPEEDLGYGATPTAADLGYGDEPSPSGADLGYGDPDDLGYGQAPPSGADLGYGDPDAADLGYGSTEPDLGYGNAGPDLGYGNAGSDLGYGDADDLGYGDQDLGYNSDTPEPPKRSQGVRRRCSVTKYNLEEGAGNTSDDE